MNIKTVYVGGWFQRTTLHLSEIYDFLRDAKSGLALDPAKLKSLQKKLDIESLHLTLRGFERVDYKSKSGVFVRITEDGLIVLNREFTLEGDLATDVRSLTTYYDNQLSPALGYIFSLGAPVPKEIANIKTIYPYFVVVENAERSEIAALMEQFKEKTYFESSGEHFDLFRGDKLYIIHLKGEDGEKHSKHFIEEQIFLREFKAQLHQYLNLHRTIWENIAKVKEQGAIKGGDVGGFRHKIQGYAKTINLIEARINQMGAYLRTRERIVKSDESLKGFISLLEYRYEAMGDTLDYLKQIWNMTKNYVNSANDLFGSLESQATQNSVKNLTVVTSMGVGATLIGLFTTSSIPKFTLFGLGYFVVLAAIGYFANRITNWFYIRKSYKISDVDYDKDIK